jgi:large subunit ribosomal protein L28
VARFFDLKVRKDRKEELAAGCRKVSKSGKIYLLHIKFRTRLEQSMAHVCDICGKGPQFGNNISHAHNVTKRRWNVNLRPVHAKVGAATRRIRVCTSCLRSGKVVKA